MEKNVGLERLLFIDVFKQTKLLLNGVSIGIQMWPSLDAFRLISDSITPDQKVQIVDACSNV